MQIPESENRGERLAAWRVAGRATAKAHGGLAVTTLAMVADGEPRRLELME